MRTQGQLAGKVAGKRDSARRNLWLIVTLIVMTLAVYAQVYDFSLLSFDDDRNIADNKQVQAGLTGASVRWAFTTTHENFYMPLVWLSFMADRKAGAHLSSHGVHLGSDNSGVYHLTNLALHLASTVLLFLMLSKMTGRSVLSAFVAALFAIHPLHVESVAWAVERKDVLSGFFWILTVATYAWYAAKPGVARYLLVAVAFALGLLAKPMLVTLPVVLLLVDYWPLCRLRTARSGRLVLEKLPLLAMAAAVGVLSYGAQKHGGALPSLEDYPFGVRLGNAVVSYVVYIQKTLVPTELAPFYPHSGEMPSLGLLVGCASLLLAITIVALRYARRMPYVFFGWFWYVISLGPVIGLIQIGGFARADRFTYLPLIGVFVAVVWTAAEMCERRCARLAASVGILVTLAFAAAAFVQVSHWRNDDSLFTHTLRVSPGNWVAHNLMGKNLALRGETDEAIEHLRIAARSAPGNAETNYNLGLALVTNGEVQAALGYLQEAVRIDPDYADAHSVLGRALKALGNARSAVRHLESAHRLAPSNPDFANTLAWLLATSPDGALRRPARAIEVAKRACRATGFSDPSTLDTLAAAYASAGRFGEAADTARGAEGIARQQGHTELAEDIKSRALLYERAIAYRQPAAATGAPR